MRTAPVVLAAWALLGVGAGCHPPRPPGWTEASHGRDAEPAYETLFADGVVHLIDILIEPDAYAAMQADLGKYLRPPPGAPPGTEEQGPLAAGDPIWVPVTVELDGTSWYHVGMRYKGNSSLKTAVHEGIAKLAFRLHFDRFEDDFPSIEDQRFYGFRKMTFSNAFKDPSLMRDRLAAEVFRRGGVPAAMGAFARVSVDFGQGPVYFGLYTMIEDPSDRMMEAQLGAGGGALYKPEPMHGADSGGATWSSFVEQDFDLKAGEDPGFAAVHAVLDALHADRADAQAWRAGLEAVFDAQGFLRWLAVNQVMENWDSYLCIPHNYYVYADPGDEGRMHWIPWDLNEAMLHRTGHCDPDSLAWSLQLDEADARRPLVRLLLDDAHYAQVYRDELRAAIDGAFDADWLIERMRLEHERIAPYVVGPDGERAPYTFLGSDAEFESSLDGPSGTPLIPHVQARLRAVREALDAW
ncbi:MAG: CotH kinase family protein [Deltaproteobacteria bacterium]|nr:CotH kinase family protein [Deltaproteobacteria bacterium]